MKIENKNRVYELCDMIENIKAIMDASDGNINIGVYCSYVHALTNKVMCDIREIEPILQAKLDACMEELKTL